MKNLTLDRAGKWRERVPPTPEQSEELRSATSERQAQIVQALRKPAEPADAAAAQALYDQHKIEGAVLIACDITLPSGHGIINCRVNGEHKQVRF